MNIQNMSEDKKSLRKNLLRLARQKYPEILLAGDTSTTGVFPSTWASAYAIVGGRLVTLWDTDSMRVRRKDGNYYWQHTGWGTSHKFVIACDIFHSAGLNYSKDYQRIQTRWL